MYHGNGLKSDIGRLEGFTGGRKKRKNTSIGENNTNRGTEKGYAVFGL